LTAVRAVVIDAATTTCAYRSITCDRIRYKSNGAAGSTAAICTGDGIRAVTPVRNDLAGTAYCDLTGTGN
jgi:hypothetical protein